MKQIETLSENKNYSAANFGGLDEVKDYSLIHPKTKKLVEGKLFLKDATKATGTQISFTSLPPKTELPYFHIHYNNEETYIILSGHGYFQVDDDCFEIKEGSVIRVAPDGKRGLCNTSDEKMVYMVIQSKENSLEQHTTEDGERLPVEPKWR